MSFLIAVSGKGGVGKTTVAALFVRALIQRKCTPVLAVDADPNTCLDAALGVRASRTIGRIREEVRDVAAKGLAAGISKQEMLELKIAECLVEAKDFDLIAMGRSEGAGCYCYANNVLKQTISVMASQYPYVVLDNEAGLENLSRRIVQHVNCLVMVADSSQRGIETLGRLHELTGEMGITFDKLGIVINRLRGAEISGTVFRSLAPLKADFTAAIQDDAELATYAEEGKSLLEMSETNRVCFAIEHMVDSIFSK
jgi:CO dehydrogenase maturation factor